MCELRACWTPLALFETGIMLGIMLQYVLPRTFPILPLMLSRHGIHHERSMPAKTSCSGEKKATMSCCISVLTTIPIAVS